MQICLLVCDFRACLGYQVQIRILLPFSETLIFVGYFLEGYAFELGRTVDYFRWFLELFIHNFSKTFLYITQKLSELSFGLIQYLID